MLFVLFNICSAFTITFIPSARSPPDQRFYGYLDYSSIRNSLTLFGGSNGAVSFNDLWEFSLTDLTWEKIVPLSTDIPLPRMNFGGFSSQKHLHIYIFAGTTSIGPDNDLWQFDFNFLKWQRITSKNPPTPRSLFGCTSYTEDGIDYFVISGGLTIEKQVDELYRLNTSDFSWEKLPSNGEQPRPSQDPMVQFYKGNIVQTGGFPQGDESCNSYLYSYSLTDKNWTIASNKDSTYLCRYLGRSFIYNDEFYVVFGWITDQFKDATDILKLDLNDPTSKWITVYDNVDMAKDGFSSVLVGDFVYLFAGYYTATKVISNKLERVHLDTFEFETVNDNVLIPTPRLSHSMVLINAKFYVFGGKDGDNMFNELWVFDPSTLLWEAVAALGSVPSARYLHAADSLGDAMIIWGGEDSTGLQNDMYIFNSLTLTWTKLNPISSSILPPAAKGGCLVYSSPHIYIYGGQISNGISNSLWEYNVGTNNYTLVSDSGINSTIYSTCFIKDNKFFVAFGSSYQESPVTLINYFDFDKIEWVVYHVHNMEAWDSAQAIQINLNGTIIRICGEEWMLTPTFNIDILGANNSVVYYNDAVNIALYGTAFAYFNRSIYVFGGGRTLGLNLRSTVAHNYMLTIDVQEICSGGNCTAFCSKGTFELNGTCQTCKYGEYAEGLGNTICKKCEAGTYNSNYGSTSSEQCLPCPEGTFNSFIGAMHCIDCPNNLYCPVGSKYPLSSKEDTDFLSVQPPLYQELEFASTLLSFQLTVSLTLGMFLLVIICIRRTRSHLEKFDIFIDKHNTTLNEYLMLKKTKVGGAFSLILVIAIFLLIGSNIINFQLGNIKESKGLVPLVVLESEYPNIQTSEINLIVWLDLYGGKCVDGDKCISDININPVYISCESFSYRCEMTSGRSCIIYLKCVNGKLKPGSYLQFMLTEKLSYSSRIQVNITSSSSVPDEISSVYSATRPESNYVFIGAVPTKFYFVATPSLFLSDSPNWPSPMTGYHISTGTSTTQGSQFNPSELPSVTYLQLVIHIDTSSSALLTKRYFKQDTVYFISGLLGSVFGVMGAVGGVMKTVEKQINKMSERKENQAKTLESVYTKRKNILQEMKDNSKLKKTDSSDPPESMYLKINSDTY